MTRTKAQRAAEARYDKKRAGPVPVRLNDKQRAWLEERRRAGEGLGTALKRLAKVPET